MAARKQQLVTPEPIEEDAPSVPGPNWRDWMFQPRRLHGWAILIGLLAFAPWLRQQIPQLSNRPEYRVQVDAIHLSPPSPRYVPVDLVEQVIKTDLGFRERSVLDPNLARDLTLLFSRHPWIEKIQEVRVRSAAEIRIEVIYRKPAAMVFVKTGVYPVDRYGVLLPPADFSKGEVAMYPILMDISSVPQGSIGEAWGDPEVVAAARLAGFLSEKWPQLKLRAIGLEQKLRPGARPDDASLVLLAPGGTRILWGRTTEVNHPGELEPEKKLGRLLQYLSETNDWDQPRGPYEIDIRHWQEISRRPLSRSPSSTSQRVPLGEGKR